MLYLRSKSKKPPLSATGGSVGIFLASFLSAINGAPLKDWMYATTYPSLRSRLEISSS